VRAFLLLALFLPELASASYAEYQVPFGMAVRRATVMSEGTPLAAHVLQSQEHAGKRRPAIILCQGTGGLQHYHLAPAIAFANAGYTVITFDYRGWGESGGRLVAADAAARTRKDGKPQGAQVIEVRETVDPFEQAADVAAVIAWAAGEPEVDAGRLGLWGTSLGGGIAFYAMLNDSRVKAMVAQVAAFETRRPPGAALDQLREEAARRARGELPYAGPQPRVAGKLHGQQVREKYQAWSPAEDMIRLAARSVQPAVLIIDAEKEELMDLRYQGERVFERLSGPKARVVIPGIGHYGVYREALQQATRLALDWYDKHLKP
jgi:dienelactone hydrolase